MSFEAWLIFAVFWVVFVTTLGPNAINCISNGMTYRFRRSLLGVLGILTQATLFLLLSAAGVTAFLVAFPEAFFWGKLVGAGFLIYLGIRGWITARRPIKADERTGGMYVKAFLIATINVKSITGYFAAFTQFVQPDIPIWSQMWVIMPTALTITGLSYLTYTAIGAGIGRAALGAVMNIWVRRIMAGCFIVYGVLLGSTSQPGRA